MENINEAISKLNLSAPYGAHNGNIIGDIKSYSECNSDTVAAYALGGLPNEETDSKESITLEFINSLKELAKTVYGDDKLRELEYPLPLMSKSGITDIRIAERARSIILKEENGRFTILKHRGNMMGDFHLENYTVKTREEMRALKWDDDELVNAEILISDTPYTIYKCESKILQEDEVRRFIEIMRKPRHSSSYYSYSQDYMSIEEIDDLCKVFDPIYDKQIIDYFPKELMDRFKISVTGKIVSCGLVSELRWAYIAKAGFSIVTKPLADSLADYLKGKKCLEIMAGKGVLSKALQDRGIDIVATDNKSWHMSFAYDDAWTEVENLEAGDAIRKYKNVDYILVSWMPAHVASKRIIRMIRKYNPSVKIIVVGESYGGCTSDDAWFDRVDEHFDIDFVESGIYSEMVSWEGVNDEIDIYKVTKPWLPKIVAHISSDDGYRREYIHKL